MASSASPTESSYPPGTQFWETPDWAGGQQARLNIALVVISTFIVLTRLYTRVFMSKTPGWDDLIAVLALGVVCSQSAFNIHLSHHGAGAHLELIPPPDLLEFFIVREPHLPDPKKRPGALFANEGGGLE